MNEPTPAPATTAARVLVQTLAQLGVRDVVLSPGSRSAPLAYALAAAALPDAERPAGAPAIELHVRIDERVAGFLALGIARGRAAFDGAAGGDGATSSAAAPRPVAIVTTSGTAVANLHPAVLEAHHAGVPLVLLTADRPHELRGTGANQTTDQVGIYGSAVRFAADVPAPSGRPGEGRDLRHLVARAVAAARGARTGDPGPVHLDLAFREPLAPGPADGAWPEMVADGLVSVVARGAIGLEPASAGEVTPLTAAARQPSAGRAAEDDVPTVVVAGDGAGRAARRVAEVNGWPLLAEPSSGAVGGPNAVPAYRLLLGDARLGGAVRRAVVLGRPTLSRPVQSLLARDDVEVLVVAPRGATWPDAARNARTVVADVPPRLLGMQDGVPVAPVATAGEWLERWRIAGASASSAVDRVVDGAPRGRRSRSGPRISGPQLARQLVRALGPDDVLVVGSSNPVRDLDLVGGWGDEPPIVLANRGLAGIDGTVSTAVGVALAARQAGRGVVRALLGDLTFLHDVGGLLRGPLETDPDLQLVVANDDGGSIFATLEHGAPEHAAAFERVFATPHGADLAALCAGYGVRHALVRDADELAVALATPGSGVSVVEVRVDRARRRTLQEEIAAAVRDALGEAAAATQ